MLVYHSSFDCESLIRPDTFIVMLEGEAIEVEGRRACRKYTCMDTAAEWAERLKPSSTTL